MHFKALNLFICLLMAYSGINCFAQDIKVYSLDSVLKWKDYQGEVPSYDAKEGAISTVQLHVSYSIENKFLYCEARFYPRLSWVRVKSAIGLTHENYHFKITEWYKRELLNEANNTLFDCQSFHEDLTRIADKYARLHSNEHDIYDEMTNFSRDSLAQKAYENKIDSNLTRLQKFDSDTLKLQFREGKECK